MPWRTRFPGHIPDLPSSSPQTAPARLPTCRNPAHSAWCLRGVAKERRPQTPTGDPSGRDRSRRETLIIHESSVSRDEAVVINRPDEERFPGDPIINRPEGEAVPEREKRFRIARSTAGRGFEAERRLGGSRWPQKKTGYARPVIIPNAIPTSRTEVPMPYNFALCTDGLDRNGFITARRRRSTILRV